MPPEKQRLAIAELFYTQIDTIKWTGEEWDSKTGISADFICDIPNYPKSLDAIQAAILSQSFEVKCEIESRISVIVRRKGCFAIELPALYFCECFLKSLNLWEAE